MLRRKKCIGFWSAYSVTPTTTRTHLHLCSDQALLLVYNIQALFHLTGERSRRNPRALELQNIFQKKPSSMRQLRLASLRLYRQRRLGDRSKQNFEHPLNSQYLDRREPSSSLPIPSYEPNFPFFSSTPPSQDSDRRSTPLSHTTI